MMPGPYQTCVAASNALTEIFSESAVQSIESDEFAALLPASRRVDKNLVLESPKIDSIYDCLAHETQLDRLDKIHKQLWMAGLPRPPRALHYQKLLNREICITEDLDMHLVWEPGRIFIKPLPLFVLEPCFWNDVLQCPVYHTGHEETDKPRHSLCPCQQLGQCRARAWGLLFSYAGLVASKSDYKIAIEAEILPPGLKWSKWRKVVKLVLGDTEIYRSIDRRFIYGELRLSRLNKIYFYKQTPGKQYRPRWNSYDAFFQENMGVIVGATTYAVIILTAMQVGLASTPLKNNIAFNWAAYGFTIFSILGPLVAAGLIVAFFFYLVLVNLLFTNRTDAVMDARHRVKVPLQDDLAGGFAPKDGSAVSSGCDAGTAEEEVRQNLVARKDSGLPQYPPNVLTRSP